MPSVRLPEDCLVERRHTSGVGVGYVVVLQAGALSPAGVVAQPCGVAGDEPAVGTVGVLLALSLVASDRARSTIQPRSLENIW